MRLVKLRLDTGDSTVGLVEDDRVRVLDLSTHPGVESLTDILHADNPTVVCDELLAHSPAALLWEEAHLLPPLDQQEVWAAGVTYRRSKVAREEESVGAAQFYDKVYAADRPELFLKAPAYRVRGPNQTVRIRRDSNWNVPEPEWAIVADSSLRIVGYTIGNDMSSRDIEGENPLYLPQAKIYDGSCAIGPCITLPSAFPSIDQVTIELTVRRADHVVFRGDTHLNMMARSGEDLMEWVGKEISFPHGVVLMTGTGIVPPDDFTLQSGDQIEINITGIGMLRNVVE